MELKRTLRLALLRGVPLLFSPGRRRPYGSRPRILLLRPDHLGDMILAMPAVRALREAFPNAHLACLVGPWAEAVVRHNPHIDEVITCSFPGFTRRPKGAPWAPYVLLIREARRLSAKNYDLAINLRFDFWWGALLVYLAGIPVRWGYDLPETRPFLTERLPYLPGRHEVIQNLALVRAVAREPEVAAAPDSHPLEFWTKPKEEAFAAAWLRDHRAGRPLVALHVGAGAPVKLWGTDAFAYVGDSLARQGAHIVLVGGGGERERVDAVAERMRMKALAFVGHELGELAALLRHCDLAIGVDSGVLHLAVAMGTPTVHLYGPVDPAIFGPWGPSERHVVVTAGMECAPCNRLDFPPRELDRHTCITSIHPERVLEAAERVLMKGVS